MNNDLFVQKKNHDSKFHEIDHQLCDVSSTDD